MQRATQSSRIPLIAGGLAVAAMSAALVAILAGQATTPLYIGATIAAATALFLAATHLLATRPSANAWAAIAPLAIITALLGAAATGASCGPACTAAAGPAAAATLLLPDLSRAWNRATLRRGLARSEK